MPISKNILIPQGLGPLTFGSYKPLPYSFWQAVTGLSLVGGVLLVRGVVGRSVVLMQRFATSGMKHEDVIQIFFVTAVGAYALPILWGGFWDRYLLPLVPFLLYLNACGVPREGVGAAVRQSAAAVLISFTAAFAVLGTRDFLTWHRVGWEALAELQQTAGVGAPDIDGGFEYNGWFFDGPLDRENAEQVFVNKNAKYRIAIVEKPGFKVVKTYKYFSWLPPKVCTLYVLERDT